MPPFRSVANADDVAGHPEVMGYSEGRTGLLNTPRPLAFALAGRTAVPWAVRAGERGLLPGGPVRRC